MEDIYSKIFKKKCAVCGHVYMADVYDQGECLDCGWYNGSMYCEFPDRVMCPNLISLNKAKKLYREGKPFLPDFDDFIDGFNFYGEMEFAYKGTLYGLMDTDEGVEFFKVNGEYFEIFKDIEEFQQKAQINGKHLKEIWNEVENVNWLQ